MQEREHTATGNYQNIGRRGSAMAPEVVSPLVEEIPASAAAVTWHNSHPLGTPGIACAEATKKDVVEVVPAPPPVSQ